MNTRENKIQIPEKKRYWSVKIDAQEQLFHFRFPTYSAAREVLNFIDQFQKGSELSVNDLVELLPAMGAIIGTCWYHESLELEQRQSNESINDFGTRVCDELQEEDLNILDILLLFNACTKELVKRSAVNALASETANFTQPPKEGASSTS